MHRQRVLAALFCAIVLIAFPATTFADTGFNQFLGQLEQIYQLPSGILTKIALVENSGKATGCSSANACGMFQWTQNSWLSATKALFCNSSQPAYQVSYQAANQQYQTCGPLNLSLRNNPEISAKVTAYELADIKYKLGGLISQARVDTTVGIYLGHFLGINGAQHFLSDYIQNPAGSACALFPKECAYNSSIMSGRTLAGVINLFASRLQQPGVLNVAGNFQDSTGVSYAYSSADLSASNFLPANTAIGVDPQYDYAPVYTSVASQQPAPLSSTAGTGTVLPNAPQTTPPASYTTAPQAAQALSSSAAVPAASSSSACAPQYSCSNNTVYYESGSCIQSVFQMCKYGCSGTICAPTPSAANSSPILNTQPIVTTGSGSGLDLFGTSSTSFFSATSTSVGTATSLSLNGGLFSVVQEGAATSLTTGATTSIETGGTPGFGQPTFAPSSYSQNVYVPARVSPLMQVLGELKTALGGFLNYLRSL